MLNAPRPLCDIECCMQTTRLPPLATLPIINSLISVRLREQSSSALGNGPIALPIAGCHDVLCTAAASNNAHLKLPQIPQIVRSLAIHMYAYVVTHNCLEDWNRQTAARDAGGHAIRDSLVMSTSHTRHANRNT